MFSQITLGIIVTYLLTELINYYVLEDPIIIRNRIVL